MIGGLHDGYLVGGGRLGHLVDGTNRPDRGSAHCGNPGCRATSVDTMGSGFMDAGCGSACGAVVASQPIYFSQPSDSCVEGSVPGTDNGRSCGDYPSSGRHLTSTVVYKQAIFWPWIGVALWGMGASLLAVRSVWREIYFRRILGTATERVDLQVSLAKSVTGIWETPARAPGGFGLWRPIIVVPPGLVEQLTPRQLQWVWRHELNHVRHRDIATRWAMELVAIVYWFNPFVWIARVSLRTAQELAADSAVVHDLPSEQRIQYGRLLLVVATYDGGTVPSLAEMQLRRATG